MNYSLNSESARLFFYYVVNRHEIQMKKDKGSPFPWTDDPILRDNSFTCNRRIDDKTTKWLINHVTNNNQLSFEDRFWRTIVFRIYNRIQTAEAIQLDSNDFWSNLNNNVEILNNLPFDPYTHAYRAVALKRLNLGYDNWRSANLLRVNDLRNNYDGRIPEDFSDPLKGFQWIRSLKCLGDFLSMQILVDIMYLPEIPYSVNDNLIVKAGPGSKAGVNFIVDNPDNFEIDYEGVFYYITNNFEELCREFYDKDFNYSKIKEDLNDPYAYCVTDVQNLFCEYSKFRYLLNGTHKKRRKYYPPQER